MFNGGFFGLLGLAFAFYSFAIYYDHHADVVEWDKERKQRLANRPNFSQNTCNRSIVKSSSPERRPIGPMGMLVPAMI